MANDSKDKNSTFCWNELLTSDAEGAQAFYGKMFGWEFSSMEMGPGMTYHFMKRPGDEDPTGGMIQIVEEMGPIPPHWMSYVMVKNCAEAEAKATSLGAAVLRPTTDVGMGTMAVIQDPQGAAIALWEPKDAD